MHYKIMGIVNVTPDSFYDGGKFRGRAVEHALKLIDEGADIIDVGGESSRPGSERVTLEEELKRVTPVIEALSHRTKVKISIDTTKSEVARRAIEGGASIINDVSGLTMDPKMATVVCESGASLVLTHMLGTPKNMQTHPVYKDVVSDIVEFFKKQIGAGISQGCQFSQFILDPGIGFGKTVEHNLKILNALDSFLPLECPLLIGVSRKSFIGKLQNDHGPEERLSASLSAAVWAYLKGVTYFRVHDVLETKRALDMVRATQSV